MSEIKVLTLTEGIRKRPAMYIGRILSFDFGQQAPVDVKVLAVLEEGVKVAYLNSWAGRTEILTYDVIEDCFVGSR